MELTRIRTWWRFVHHSFNNLLNLIYWKKNVNKPWSQCFSYLLVFDWLPDYAVWKKTNGANRRWDEIGLWLGCVVLVSLRAALEALGRVAGHDNGRHAAPLARDHATGRGLRGKTPLVTLSFSLLVTQYQSTARRNSTLTGTDQLLAGKHRTEQLLDRWKTNWPLNWYLCSLWPTDSPAESAVPCQKKLFRLVLKEIIKVY